MGASTKQVHRLVDIFLLDLSTTSRFLLTHAEEHTVSPFLSFENSPAFHNFFFFFTSLLSEARKEKKEDQSRCPNSVANDFEISFRRARMEMRFEMNSNWRLKSNLFTWGVIIARGHSVNLCFHSKKTFTLRISTIRLFCYVDEVIRSSCEILFITARNYCSPDELQLFVFFATKELRGGTVQILFDESIDGPGFRKWLWKLVVHNTTLECTIFHSIHTSRSKK